MLVSVEELIAQLQKFPKDAHVTFRLNEIPLIFMQASMKESDVRIDCVDFED